MLGNSEYPENSGNTGQLAKSALEWNLSRRSLLGAGALLGLAAIAHPTDRAFAWSSWTNATSGALKKIGMGDCVHEDLVQISYARLVREHAGDTTTQSLLNPWAGVLSDDRKTATIAGDIVERGGDETFEDAGDLAKRLFRENLAYLRIGSFWNDAASNTLVDFAYSCYHANSVPKFSGSNYYEGAWDVGQHIYETNEQNEANGGALDALVQFTMNDRNNFIHGMLSSTANHSDHLKQSEIKKFALQWLSVAYEYARTGEVKTTSDVTSQDQAEKIFKGFIDTYGQLDESAHDMRVSLKVSWSEATTKLPHRRLRLRALGMMCHTMEDFWCPAHTCRTYNGGTGIEKNSILAFSNYKLQNGNNPPMFGYHIPFDRYATSDASNDVNWREALTRGQGDAYVGTETLEKVLNSDMEGCLKDAHTKFNTLGMNETIDCITKLFEYLYKGTAWDDGVRQWIDKEILPVYFDNGQSFVCDAGRRSLHTPTYVIAPLKAMRRAYRKAGLLDNYDEMIATAESYKKWQQGAHLFYAGQYNKSGSKIIENSIADTPIRSDSDGEKILEDLANKVYEGYSSLPPEKQNDMLARVGCNSCHEVVYALRRVRGMLQEFSIELHGSLRSGDATMTNLDSAIAFFDSGTKGNGKKLEAQSSRGLLAADVAFADEGDESYVTSDMAIEDLISLDDGSFMIAVRDMDSLEMSIMTVPEGTPGVEKLKENLANLTITYTLEAEFEDDPDFMYVVTGIDYSDMQEDVYLTTGTVKQVSADKKNLTLDLNGTGETTLDIRNGAPIPEVGLYICAHCAAGASAMELIDYDELDAPGTLEKVTYPVAMVSGTSMWLLTNSDEENAADGYRDYMQIDYGSADVLSMPQEGQYATVYYHDEAYGDATGGGESALTTAAYSSDSARMSTQADDDDVDGTVDTPGYIDLGDDYGKVEYGNEVFHIANVIEGTNEKHDDTPKDNGGASPSESTSSSSSSSAASSGSSSTTPKTSGTKSTASATPKTGDPLAGFGGLLSVAAVAGTAMAAYSARRVANERSKSEED